MLIAERPIIAANVTNPDFVRTQSTPPLLSIRL